MILKQVGVLSAGKINGILSAAMGLIFGFFMSIFSLIGMAAGASGDGGTIFGALFGIGSIILFPLFYGIFGFIFGAIAALIYNAIAKFFGGLEIKLEDNSTAP